jgi:putative transposase
LEEKLVMPIKRYKPEQIATMLRQIEVTIANGKTIPQACKEAAILVQTFYRWRKEYGGLKMDQAKRLKELEKENGKLKRLVAELSLDKQILKDIADEEFELIRAVRKLRAEENVIFARRNAADGFVITAQVSLQAEPVSQVAS